ncbi:unnamed protein product, partial [marine sediment metagenome]
MMGPRGGFVKAKRRLGWAPGPFPALNLQTAGIVDNFLEEVLGGIFG